MRDKEKGTEGERERERKKRRKNQVYGRRGSGNTPPATHLAGRSVVTQTLFRIVWAWQLYKHL